MTGIDSITGIDSMAGIGARVGINYDQSIDLIKVVERD